MGSLKEVTHRKLGYFIHKCSSYSTTYVPENIQEDKSYDQSSRWSSNSNNPSQFLILKLQKVSIVKNITFGKYEKTHVCNLKKFKIYGGLNDENMIELLESGLKNNSTPETFELRHEVGGQPLPCRYLKIVPLQSWGPSFNFSIWFVELHGISDWNFVKPCIDWFNMYREREVVRHCLKHFRQMRYTSALEALAKETQVQLEDPHLTKLHEILVQKGDFQSTEDFMSEAVSCGMFSGYLAQQEYFPEWILLHAPQDPDTDCNSVAMKKEHCPGMRGGHQMCLDPSTETIYLFGGWDGNQDLSDMWSYHIPSREWKLVSPDTSQEGGPNARSCHKFCLDPERRQIFSLGRYLDVHFRSPPNLKSDFYLYDIDANSWTLITEDTGSMGGPQLIYDHQMCMDSEKQTIYVFGGRVLIPSVGISDDRNPANVANSQDPAFSGLYSYHVPTNTWTMWWDDSTPGGPRIKSRVGHSMLFHPVCRKLFIFAGQRLKEYLNDFYTLDVDTQMVQAVCDWSVSGGGDVPASASQRATIDPDLNEIYVLSGLSKDKEKRQEMVQNSFWVYYIKKNQWSCIHKNENIGEQYWHVEPCPRFAHQLVYDPINKVHYLFGGNPGRSGCPKLRLDDFWRLRLCHPTPQQLDHSIKILIRKYRFVELAAKDRFAALEYLQTDICNIIDHNNKDQTKEFQQLAAVLFQGPDCSGDLDGADTIDSEQYRQRSNLFHKLGMFFPTSMTQPQSSLLDLIPL